MQTNETKRIGRAAATLAAFFAVAYAIFQLLAVFEVISPPDGLFWLFLPSILLAPAFLITTICLHYAADADRKIFTAIGAAFATLYSSFVIMVYFTQLAVIIPQLQAKAIDETHLLSFTDHSFMVAVDCMGYTFMNASTFATAFAFQGSEKYRWLFRSLLVNGLLTPVMVAAFFIPGFLYVGSLWIITFPLAMIIAAIFFAKPSERKPKRKEYDTTFENAIV